MSPKIKRRHVRAFLTGRKATLWGRAFDLGEPESVAEAEALLLGAIREVQEIARQDMKVHESAREPMTGQEVGRELRRGVERMYGTALPRPVHGPHGAPRKAEEAAGPFSRLSEVWPGGDAPYSVADWQVARQVERYHGQGSISYEDAMDVPEVDPAGEEQSERCYPDEVCATECDPGCLRGREEGEA